MPLATSLSLLPVILVVPPPEFFVLFADGGADRHGQKIAGEPRVPLVTAYLQAFKAAISGP